MGKRFCLGEVRLRLTEARALRLCRTVAAVQRQAGQEDGEADDRADILGNLLCFHASAPLLRVLTVVVEERAYRSQSSQPSRESRVIAVGRSEIQKSLL